LTLAPTKRLGDLCDVVAGGTPSRSNADFFGGEVPWVKISDMLQGRIRTTDERLTDEGLAACRAKLLPPGTLLVSIFATIGRTAVLDIPAATNQAIVGVSPRDLKAVDRAFLRHFLDFHAVTLGRQSRGVAQNNINASMLKDVPVPVPPLAEQKRIAAILDKADAIRRRRQEAARLADTLIPSVFYEMFDKWLRQPAPEMPRIGDPSLANIASGVTKGRQFGDAVTASVPYIRVANVQDGRLDLAEIKTIEVLPGDVEALRLESGDVLMTEGGDFDKLGRGALWEADIPDCIHQNHVFRVRCQRKRLMPEFFASYIQSTLARAYFLKCAKKTSNLASINMTQLRALPLPVPPIEIQREFAKRVKATRALQSVHGGIANDGNDLFNSLVQRAFRGEL